MQVHVVTAANRARYADQMRQMFRLRHRVFVEELGWQALASPTGLETDEYDDHHAVYLLAIDCGSVRGCLRLLPTWRRSLLHDHFPQFIRETVPTNGPAIWEWTRWIPGCGERPRDLVQIRSAMLIATLEFALSRGIDTYTAMCDVKFITQLEELGWMPRPLGLPTRYTEGIGIALQWQVTPELLSHTRDLLKRADPISIEAPYCSSVSGSQDTGELFRLLAAASAAPKEAIDHAVELLHAHTAHASLHVAQVQGRA